MAGVDVRRQIIQGIEANGTSYIKHMLIFVDGNGGIRNSFSCAFVSLPYRPNNTTDTLEGWEINEYFPPVSSNVLQLL
ncbi:hypothetical protein ACWKWI_06095 [Arcticibacter tournemirensis]